MKPCKHGHVDGALHKPCYQCRCESLQAELDKKNKDLVWHIGYMKHFSSAFLGKENLHWGDVAVMLGIKIDNLFAELDKHRWHKVEDELPKTTGVKQVLVYKPSDNYDAEEIYTHDVSSGGVGHLPSHSSIVIVVLLAVISSHPDSNRSFA